MQIIISDIGIAVDSTTAVILTSKRLFKLDHLWMPTAVTPLEDMAWTVTYNSPFLLFSRDPSNTVVVSSQWFLTCGQTRSVGTNLNLCLFSMLIWMSLRTEVSNMYFSSRTSFLNLKVIIQFFKSICNLITILLLETDYSYRFLYSLTCSGLHVIRYSPSVTNRCISVFLVM